MLKVTVAEVRRSIIKQLGIDINGSLSYGTAVVNFNNSNPFTANNAPLVPGNGLAAAALNKAGVPTVTATLRAMGERGRGEDVLAEPNLTAISGEVRDIHFGRRISHSDRRDLKPNHRPRAHSEIASRPSVSRNSASRSTSPTGGADRRADQPAGDDRSVGSLGRKLFDRRCRRHHDSPRSRPVAPETNAGSAVRRLDRNGRPDPGTNQAGRQRIARSGPSLPVLGALFRSQDFVNNQDRNPDGHRDALHRPGGGPKRAVASR